MKVIGLVVVGVILFGLDLCCGNLWLSPWDWWHLSEDTIASQILLDIRLPRAITAILAGAALSVSGLMMQTLFRNPLASPYILGVSSGASLGVALVTMCVGLCTLSLPSSLSIAGAAIVGAVMVLLLVLAIARHVKSNVSLLIIGMMIGAVAGAIVNVIQNFSNPDALKLFIVWTLGSLSAVGWSEMMVMVVLILVSALFLLGLIKPLNGLLLGENYARALGVPIDRVRIGIVLVTGILSGTITAFCGLIAFIGVAVPHIARGLVHSTDHRITIPMSALVGADLLLLCDILSNAFTYPLPISTMSALFGAPIILWIILRHRNTI